MGSMEKRAEKRAEHGEKRAERAIPGEDKSTHNKLGERHEAHVAKLKAAKALSAAATSGGSEPTSFGVAAHAVFVVAALGFVLYILRGENLADPDQAFSRSCQALGGVGVGGLLAHLAAPAPHLSVDLVVCVAVLFTINPVVHPTRTLALSMGTVPMGCVLWLRGIGVLTDADCARALYGTETLRPYHLVVMFLGSVYLCTALERSGFLHTAATRVVERFGRSPWGLFWALGCFSAMLTVLIPDDIVTMTLTPITIRMCQLLNLPEVPFLFSQFFAGNIWAVTLVTGNPTNVLLAEDLGDSFLSFAGRMGLPGIAAGLTSFGLMYWTNRHKVDVDAGPRGVQLTPLSPGSDVSRRLVSSTSSSEESAAGESAAELGRSLNAGSDTSDASLEGEAAAGGAAGGAAKRGAPPGGGGGGAEVRAFTAKGIFSLVRVLGATLFCALEGVHGLPVYLVVLIIGVASFFIDLASFGAEASLDVLRHMPWELFSFVTGFLVLAEAMAVSGISLWLAAVFIPLARSRNVAYVAGFTTMFFCNVFETLPATLIVFKMIDSVPAWKPEAIAAAGGAAHLFTDARRAALSAVIFGSNFGANTACIGSLGGLMMRRLAAQQGVTVTNGMLLKQGIPVMLPTMAVACFVLVHQKSL